MSDTLNQRVRALHDWLRQYHDLRDLPVRPEGPHAQVELPAACSTGAADAIELVALSGGFSVHTRLEYRPGTPVVVDVFLRGDESVVATAKAEMPSETVREALRLGANADMSSSQVLQGLRDAMDGAVEDTLRGAHNYYLWFLPTQRVFDFSLGSEEPLEHWEDDDAHLVSTDPIL